MKNFSNHKEMILIQDVPFENKCLEAFASLGVTVLRGIQMTADLMSMLGRRSFCPATTLVVFPGNGANIVRNFLDNQWLGRYYAVSVFAKRYWEPGSAPFVVTERIFPYKMKFGIREILIIDDVISSGQTCSKLWRINSPWFPGARWYAGVWVAQRSRNLSGYESVCVAKECGERNRKIPINSLFTLLASSEIASSYAERRFHNPQKFLDILSQGGY